MMEYGHLLAIGDQQRIKEAKYRLLVLLVAPALAILLQVYVPLFFEYLGYLELPLLITVYFALMRQRPVTGLFYGAIIGLVQDSLSNHPLGVFGIAKTLVGYLASHVGLQFDVDRLGARFVLAFLFYGFHQTIYWLMTTSLLGSEASFSLLQTVLIGVMNGAVAVPLFHLLDKLKEAS